MGVALPQRAVPSGTDCHQCDYQCRPVRGATPSKPKPSRWTRIFLVVIFYDQAEGPYRGLALARRMALINYRSPSELNDRFERTWQSAKSPLGDNGRFAVESYLDFHGNKFTRRFDANSYIALVIAMNSHDITRDRAALNRFSVPPHPTLVLGITSDRLFPVAQQHELAAHIPHTLHGTSALVVESPYGHDGFLIEAEAVGAALKDLLTTPPL